MFAPSVASADEIARKDGGILRGEVMEVNSGGDVRIRLVSGETRTVAAVEIAEIRYGAAALPEASPAPTASSADPAGPPVRPGAEADGEPWAPLWITGLSTFLGVYVTTLVATPLVTLTTPSGKRYAAERAGEAAVPLVGPWIILGVANDVLGGPEIGLLVFSGLAQAAGAGMLIGGLSVRVPSTDVVVRPTAGGLAISGTL